MSEPLSARYDGPEDAPVVVFLHPIATSSALWAPQVDVLSSEYRTIAIDLPGHGESAVAPGDPTIEGYARSVLATLASLGVTRCSVVGLSLGSSIAQVMAVTDPARICSVVLAGGTAFPPPAVQAMWRERAADARINGMAGQVEAILGRWFTPEFVAASPGSVEVIRQMVLATPSEGYALAAEAIAGLDNRAILASISCPVLVVAGENDVAVPLEALQLITRSIPGSRLATVPAAHLMSVEAATPFTQLVSEHLTSSQMS